MEDRNKKKNKLEKAVGVTAITANSVKTIYYLGRSWIMLMFE